MHKRFLPPKYDYSRPIPASLIPQHIPNIRSPTNSDEDRSSLLENDVLNETGPRNRKEKRSRNGVVIFDDRLPEHALPYQGYCTSR